MKLYTPQVQLFRETVLDGPDEYILHAVTFCGRTDLKAAGHTLNSGKPVEDNVLRVSLLIGEQPEMPRLNSLTPIVHTVQLGALPFDGPGMVETEVLIQPAEGTRDINATVERKGKNSSSTTSAKEVDRPLDEG